MADVHPRHHDQSPQFPLCFQSVNIPMSVEAIDRLIKRLDEDGDGEVDYRYLYNVYLYIAASKYV